MASASGTKRADRKSKIKISGHNAVAALFRARPQDIQRVVLLKAKTRDFGALLKWCAGEKRPYTVTEDPAELQRFGQSTHHEGIVVEATPKKTHSADRILRLLERAPKKASALALVGIENPHNVGAICRTAAHFGVDLVLLESDPQSMALKPAAYRVAEGGVERLEFVQVPPKGWRTAFARVEECGFKLYGTSSHAEHPFQPRSAGPRVCFAMGNEARGLPRELLKQVETVCIPGSGYVESLNVSSATTALLTMNAISGA